MLKQSRTTITGIATAIAIRSISGVLHINAEESSPNCENIIFSIEGTEKALLNQDYSFAANGYELSYQSGNNTGEQTGTKSILATGDYKSLL